MPCSTARAPRRHVALRHSRRRPCATSASWRRRDLQCGRKNHDQLRRTADDPKLARAFLLRSSLIESLREAEQID